MSDFEKTRTEELPKAGIDEAEDFLEEDDLRIRQEKAYKMETEGFFPDQTVKAKGYSGEVEDWKIEWFYSLDNEWYAILRKYSHEKERTVSKKIPLKKLRELNPVN